MRPEVRIYNRKQESQKKERQHALDQEANQENDQEKRKFLLFAWSRACFSHMTSLFVSQE